MADDVRFVYLVCGKSGQYIWNVAAFSDRDDAIECRANLNDWAVEQNLCSSLPVTDRAESLPPPGERRLDRAVMYDREWGIGYCVVPVPGGIFETGRNRTGGLVLGSIEDAL